MKKISIIIYSLFLFYSCSTDFEINADWEDITVVFALLDQSDTVHYVKIGKAFLGDESFFTMAQEPDSLYYDTSQITAYLHELSNGLLLRIIPLEPDYSIPKDSGLFFSDYQIIYKTDEILNEEFQYRVYVEKNSENEPITAITSIVNDFIVEKPNLNIPNFDLNFTSELNGPDIIKFHTAENAKFYEVTIRFHYTEQEKLNLHNTVLKYVDWVLDEKDDGDAVSQKITYTFSFDEDNTDTIPSLAGGNFFKFINGVIDENENVNRHPEYIDILIAAGGEDLYTYMEVNEPSIGIVQYRPEYSNIEPNDISTGLFSTRYNKWIENIPLDDNTIQELSCSPYTNHLNFAWYQINTTAGNNVIDTLYYPNCD